MARRPRSTATACLTVRSRRAQPKKTAKTRKKRTAKTAVEVLWEKYAGDHDNLVLRNALVEHYLHLVEIIAQKMRYRRRIPVYVTLESMVSAGSCGLIRAVELFEPARGLSFATYAGTRITGAILDDLRDADHASRLTRSREAKAETEVDRLVQVLGRNPTDEEVTERLGKQAADHRHRLLAPISFSVAAGDREDGGRNVLAEILACASKSGYNGNRFFERLTRGMEFHPRMCLWFYFLRQKRMREIGQFLDLSESRISQTITDALAWLRQNRTRDEVFELFQDTCGRHSKMPGEPVDEAE